MPFNSIILTTRPLDDSLIRKAAENNIVVETASLIETQPVADDALRAKVIELAAKDVTVAFTSINAAKAVSACLQGRNPSWTVFTIGTATRDYIGARFGGSRIAGVADRASELAELVVAAGTREIIFFCGDKRRDELPDRLAASGVKLEEIIVYTTVYSTCRTDKAYDGVLFFSPGAVKSFFSVNTVAAGAVLFAIGSTTAASIRSCSGNAVVESGTPSAESLVDIVITHFSITKTQHERTKE